eukprot:TRINITY_DN667_c0_g1_i27.p1 TRINITY_DN667_c0_g1~~TRINITY_DN667_c0_g1_i27.p1  ORF type:complete len:206 (-),score=50.16 TRINITY_DN667_c0_g1_i27:104-721(-)
MDKILDIIKKEMGNKSTLLTKVDKFHTSRIVNFALTTVILQHLYYQKISVMKLFQKKKKEFVKKKESQKKKESVKRKQISYFKNSELRPYHCHSPAFVLPKDISDEIIPEEEERIREEERIPEEERIREEERIPEEERIREEEEERIREEERIPEELEYCPVLPPCYQVVEAFQEYGQYPIPQDISQQGTQDQGFETERRKRRNH